MNRLSEDASRVLDSARRALMPDAEDKARNRARLGALVAAGALPSVELPAGADLATAPSSASGGFLQALAHSPGHFLAAAALVGGIGFGSGYLVGQKSGVSRDDGSAAGPSPARAAPATVATSAPNQAESKRARESLDAIDPAPAPTANRAAASLPPRPEPATNGSAKLAEEVELLRAAQQELRSGNPSGALHLLDELAQKHPEGALLEEREAARVIAQCASGRSAGAMNAARAFLKGYPRSAYSGRVRSGCGLGASTSENDGKGTTR